MNKLLAALAAFLFLLAGCSGRGDPVIRNAFLLDTAVTITVYDRTVDGSVLDGAVELCRQYERVFSRTDPQSEVYRLNHAGGGPVAVSPEVRDVLARAVRFAELSGGRYDVTICPVVDLWDFTGGGASLPDPGELSQALARVDYRRVRIEGDTVQLLDGAQVDLGSIAKGYIADRMADYLVQSGVRSAIVNLGGDVRTVGSRPDGKPFRIGVQKPFGRQGQTVGIVEASGRAVVSSGIYERGFELDGVLYHHILDPATGYPARTGLAAVTVVADTSMDGDAVSTCLFLLGVEQGLAFAESLPGVDAILIDGQGGEHFTSGFSDGSAVYVARAQ